MLSETIKRIWDASVWAKKLKLAPFGSYICINFDPLSYFNVSTNKIVKRLNLGELSVFLAANNVVKS